MPANRRSGNAFQTKDPSQMAPIDSNSIDVFPASTSLARYTAPYLADRSRHRIAERCLISWIGNGLSTKIFNTVPDFRPMSRPSLPAGPPTTWAVAETQTA